MSEYSAKIVQLFNVRKHPNADRIKLADVSLNGKTGAGINVIVGLDVVEGQVGIFFPSDSKLSQEYADKNGLTPQYDADGKKLPGYYFSDNLRVKTIRMRGEKSEGFWMPLQSLDYLNDIYGKAIDWHLGAMVESFSMPDGDEHKICEKYFNPKTEALRNTSIRTQRRAERDRQFPRHYDTLNLRYFIDMIPRGAKITISEKVHGTSTGLMKRRAEIILNWWKTQWNKIVTVAGRDKWKYPTSESVVDHRTRNVIIGPESENPFHGSNKYHFAATRQLDNWLQDGMVVYGELLNEANGKLIMHPHETARMAPAVRKRYGDRMAYTYGGKPGETLFMPYRIGYVNEIGIVTDLSVEAVQEMAEKFGYLPLKILDTFEYDGNQEALLAKAIGYAESEDGSWSPSLYDDRHMSEGVVIRVDYIDDRINRKITNFYKLKSYDFRTGDGINKDANIVDEEEVS